jgi:hypothetical protein
MYSIILLDNRWSEPHEVLVNVLKRDAPTV